MVQRFPHLQVLLIAITIFATMIIAAEEPAVSEVAEWDFDHAARLIASGSGSAVNAFWGSIGNPGQLFRTRRGYVLSHTNLETGETKWLCMTGELLGVQRYPLNSTSRIVGLAQFDSHFVVVTFEAPWRGWKRPSTLSTKDGSYRIRVYSMAEGENIYSWMFDDSVPQEIVPAETLEEGVIEMKDQGFVVFNYIFEFTEEQKIVRRKLMSR